MGGCGATSVLFASVQAHDTERKALQRLTDLHVQVDHKFYGEREIERLLQNIVRSARPGL